MLHTYPTNKTTPPNHNHRVRSFRELPIRMAEFGVLHRNEVSGALTGAWKNVVRVLAC